MILQQEIRNERWRILTHLDGIGSVGGGFVQIPGKPEFNIYRRPVNTPGRPFAMCQGSYWTDEFGRFPDKRILTEDRRRPIVMRDHFHPMALHGAVPTSTSLVTESSPISVTYVRNPGRSECWPVQDRITKKFFLRGNSFVQQMIVEHLDDQPVPRVMCDHPFYVDAANNPLIITASFESVSISLGGLEAPMPLDFPVPIIAGSELDYSNGRRVPACAEHSYYGLISAGIHLEWPEAGVRVLKTATWKLNDGTPQPVRCAHGFTGLRYDSPNFDPAKGEESTTAFENVMSGAGWNLLDALGFIGKDYGGVITRKGDRLVMTVAHICTGE